MKKCVSKNFLEYCNKKYPAIKNNIEYRKMFIYLLYGTYTEIHDNDHKNNLLLPMKIMRNIVDLKSHRTSVESFLKNFQKDVLPNFTWSDPQYYNDFIFGKCRSVTNKGLDDEDIRLSRQEIYFTGNKYYFDTESCFNGRNKNKQKNEVLQKYKNDSEHFALNETQKLIMDELSEVSLNGGIFTRKLKQNKKIIHNTIDNLNCEEERKDLQRNIIGSIDEDARIFYKPTPLKHTCRLYHSTDCVLSLKSDVRQSFCHGWTEVDLSSSQFYIVAAILNATLSLNFLESNKNIWTYLNNDCVPNKEEKSVLKQFLYSICFGMGEKPGPYSKTTLTDILTPINRLDLLKNPIIRELLDKRDTWHKDIKAKTYVFDIWGEKHCLEKKGIKTDIYGNKVIMARDRWSGALAATYIQSIEMEIMHSIFQYKQNNYTKQFNIVLFQHDGITISFTDKSKKELIQKQLQAVVKNKAIEIGKRLDIDISHMHLEFKDL